MFFYALANTCLKKQRFLSTNHLLDQVLIIAHFFSKTSTNKMEKLQYWALRIYFTSSY